MDTIQLCSKLEEATYSVEVFSGQELISSGSAVAVTDNGYLLTAAHVVVRLTHIDEDLKDDSFKVVARTKSIKYRQYEIGICAPRCHLDKYLRDPLILDLAVLTPKQQLTGVPHFKIRTSQLVVGEKVLMAGYPDDMELPFSFDRHLNYQSEEVQQQRVNLEISRRIIMIKSGMIGQKHGFDWANPTDNIHISGEVMYIDNVMHSGASGGPVVSSDGELVGIITQRAITQVPYEDTPGLRVPSGSAVAVTPRAFS